MNVRRALVVILLAVVLDAVGVGLMFPILPALMRELAGTDEISARFGLMLTIYAAMQFLFAPVLGALSDRYGRRPVLLLSLAGATLDYLFMAVAPQLWMLFLGRAIAGLTSANMAVATAVMADVSDEADRARRFGYIHAGFGVGFVLGPALGGTLGAVHLRAPFAVSAALCGINLLLALFALPETRPSGPARAATMTSPLRQAAWVLARRPLLPMLAIYVVMSFVGQIYGTLWVLYNEDRFGWDGRMIGVSLTAYGACQAGAQALLTDPVIRRVGARPAIALGLLLEAACCVALALATSGWAVFVLLPLLALSGLNMPALQSLLSGAVGTDQQGRLQGLLSSLVSLTAIVGPLFFAGLYAATRHGWNGWAWLCAPVLYGLISPVLARLPASPRGDGPRDAEGDLGPRPSA